jgi:septal ring factor EnvC (AmiA/AmiB activator)
MLASNRRRRTATRLAIVAGLGIALLLAVARFGVAANPDSLEAAKRAELERIQREAREKREAAQRLKGQEVQAVGQLKRAERELGTTRKRLRSLQSERKKLDRELTVTRADLDRSLSSLGSQRERLAQRLRHLYMYGSGRELEFLLSTQSFAQLLARWDFLVMVAEQDRVLLENIEERKNLVEANQSRLERNLNEVQRNARRTDQETRRLTSLRSERAQSVQKIQNQREAYEAAALELEKTARAIQRLLADLEQKRKDPSRSFRPPYAGDFSRGQGRLNWPVQGRVVGRFGPETHPRWGTVTMNNGIDIEAPIGSAVRAVANGRVEYVSEDFGTYGVMLILNHGDGYYTLYGHLLGVGVVVGQEVQSGQVIAESGDTGSLKGPVLHFEVRRGGQSLDPQDWLE